MRTISVIADNRAAQYKYLLSKEEKEFFIANDFNVLSEQEGNTVADALRSLWSYGREGIVNYVGDAVTDGVLEMIGIRPNGILGEIVSKIISESATNIIMDSLRGNGRGCETIAKSIVRGIIRGAVSEGLQTDLALSVTDVFGIDYDSLLGGVIKSQIENFFAVQATRSEYSKQLEAHIKEFLCELDLSSLLSKLKNRVSNMN